nr:insulinase family protein [Candidatus Enterousia merdequi]
MKFEPKLYHLSNGIPVILDDFDIATTLVKIEFYTGGRDETLEEYGITHFCEHILCKGTHRFQNQKARTDFLENKGGYVNASTGLTCIRFYGRIISENLPVLIDVLADQINDSLFDEQKIEIERGTILDEFRRDFGKSESQKHDFIEKTLFNRYVPNGVLVLGNKKNITSFTREQLLDFMKRRFSADNCQIIISGKIDNQEEIIQQLEKLFINMSTHKVCQNKSLKYTPAVAHQSRDEMKNVRMVIVFPNLYPDDYEHLNINRAVGMFEHYLAQELREVLRHQNGLVYSLSTCCFGNDDCCVNGFETETSPQNIEKLVALMAKTAYRVYTENPITSEDIIRFKNADKLRDAMFLESAERRNSQISGFLRDFNQVYNFYADKQSIDNIKLEDVIKYSRGYFDGPMSIITQGADFNVDLKQIWIDNFK